MRPHIICHMASTLDGRIDDNAVDVVANPSPGDYYVIGDMLQGDAWLCGRATMQKHFAEPEYFVSASGKAAGPRPVHVARRADAYVVSVDTLGKLRWPAGEVEGSHLICVVSEQASEDYLAMLREQGISCIVSGAHSVDLAEAMRLLRQHFGIRRLLLEGGGHINGAFLAAGLVDEVSLLLVPTADGRHGIPALFDGIEATDRPATQFRLKSVEQRANDVLWIRYDLAPPEST